MDAIGIAIGVLLLWIIIRYTKPSPIESLDGQQASGKQSDTRQRVEISETDLPMRVEGYVYRNYLIVFKYILAALFLVSACFSLVAAMVMLVGPDSVTVRAGVIGLQEFVQIYPGHSFLAGVFTTMGVFELHKRATEDCKKGPRQYFERHVELVCPPGDHTCESVDIEYLGRGCWQIQQAGPGRNAQNN